MLGINRQPWVDLDSEIDTSSFEDLHREICVGLTKCTTSYLSFGVALSRGNAALDLYDYEFKDVAHAWRDVPSDEQEWVMTLSKPERYKYLMIAHGAYFPWAYCVNLLNSDWEKIMETEGKVFTSEATRLFPKTIEYIKSLPFKGIGRVLIFGRYPCQPATCHRDRDPATYLTNNNFITFAPRPNNYLYMYNEETKTKHPVTSKVYTFSDCDYHGVEPAKYFTYSVRVDGPFTPEFASRFEYRTGV